MVKYQFIAFLISISCLLVMGSADVGLVVEFPNGTVYSKCVSISDGKNPVQVLREAGLNAKWSDEGQWGRALCMINGIGTKPSGSGCEDWSSYWAFSLSLDEDSSWTAHSPVGSTAGECWNRDYETPSYSGHYCTKNGDVLGYHFTDKFPSDYPKFILFRDLCKKAKDGSHEKKASRAILPSSWPFWEKYCKKCGVKCTNTMSPQLIRKLCREKLAEMNNTCIMNDTCIMNASEDVSGNLTLQNQTRLQNQTPVRSIYRSRIQYDYYPKIIKNLDEPFSIAISSSGSPLAGIPVLVNKIEYATDSNGRISFPVKRGDYTVEVHPQEFADFKVTFRIGG